MLAAAAEAAVKLEGEMAEAEPQPAQLGELEFEAAHSYVVKGHGWQWSAELGCWPAPAGPPLWTAAQAEVYTGQANATVWKPKIAITASLFHDVSTAQLPPSHSPTAPRVPVPPAALTPTKEASPRVRRRGVNAVYLKQNQSVDWRSSAYQSHRQLRTNLAPPPAGESSGGGTAQSLPSPPLNLSETSWRPRPPPQPPA